MLKWRKIDRRYSSNIKESRFYLDFDRLNVKATDEKRINEVGSRQRQEFWFFLQRRNFAGTILVSRAGCAWASANDANSATNGAFTVAEDANAAADAASATADDAARKFIAVDAGKGLRAVTAAAIVTTSTTAVVAAAGVERGIGTGTKQFRDAFRIERIGNKFSRSRSHFFLKTFQNSYERSTCLRMRSILEQKYEQLALNQDAP